MIANQGRVSTGLMLFGVVLLLGMIVAVNTDPCMVRANTPECADGAAGPTAIERTDHAFAETRNALAEAAEEAEALAEAER